jgi:hypothetical protein
MGRDADKPLGVMPALPADPQASPTDRQRSELIVSEKVKRAGESQLDFVGDVIDATLDSVLSEDVLNHVPIIKGVVAIWRSGVALSDQLLLRKIDKFLRAISDVPAEDRRTMVDRLESDPAYGRKVGEHVVELLDRVDSKRKPLMIGYAFAAYAKGQISVTILERLCGAIEALPTWAIDSVRAANDSCSTEAHLRRVESEVMQVVANAGFLETQSGYGGMAYKPNNTASAFLTLVLDIRSAEAEATG